MAQSRRDFIKKAGLGLGALTILPREVFGKMGDPSSKFVAPSDQMVCDVDQKHLDNALQKGQERFGTKLQSYHDWRDLVHDPNVDIVHIATPSHWHGLMAVESAKAGKDIFCEKPMTRTIGEGKKVVEAVNKYGRIFRLDTWFRFKDTFYGLGTTVEPLKKLVDSGLLGWPLTVRISGATGFAWKFYWTGKENLEPQPVPKELDYDMWLGPAPVKPYHPHRVHQSFRGYWDYESGGLGDMGQHYIDPVQYFLGKDNDLPVKVEVDAPQQHPDAVGIWRSITYTYADQDIINELPDPEPRQVDFLDCVQNRQKFALNEENGHHSCTIVNMGSCALRLGRTLHFDPDKQLFIGDDAANLLVNQPMRAPWSI